MAFFVYGKSNWRINYSTPWISIEFVPVRTSRQSGKERYYLGLQRPWEDKEELRLRKQERLDMLSYGDCFICISVVEERGRGEWTV